MSHPHQNFVQPTPSPIPTFNPYTKNISIPTQPRPLSTHHQSTITPAIHPDDSRWFGQRIHPNVSTCRFLVQNPNGIDTNDNCLEFESILHDMKRYKIDMLMLSETNINAHNYRLVDNLRAASSLHLTTPILNITNTPFFPHSNYQPGGVLTVASNVLSSRSASTNSDPAGRWSCNSFYGKQSFLKVYCIYRVGNLTAQGTTTAAAPDWPVVVV